MFNTVYLGNIFPYFLGFLPKPQVSWSLTSCSQMHGILVTLPGHPGRSCGSGEEGHPANRNRPLSLER